MNQQLKNRIEANDTSIKELLKEQKFYIDYFQREYRWGENHIKTLIEDLTTTFLKSYKDEDRSIQSKHSHRERDGELLNMKSDENQTSTLIGQYHRNITKTPYKMHRLVLVDNRISVVLTHRHQEMRR